MRQKSLFTDDNIEQIWSKWFRLDVSGIKCLMTEHHVHHI